MCCIDNIIKQGICALLFCLLIFYIMLCPK
nr:MAG TPA: holin family protein [Caudoviricetes sp.]